MSVHVEQKSNSNFRSRAQKDAVIMRKWQQLRMVKVCVRCHYLLFNSAKSEHRGPPRKCVWYFATHSMVTSKGDVVGVVDAVVVVVKDVVRVSV